MERVDPLGRRRRVCNEILGQENEVLIRIVLGFQVLSLSDHSEISLWPEKLPSEAVEAQVDK